MTGSCIISFDCEGKWGMVDALNQTHRTLLTNENLISAYTEITQILKDYNLPATFAFVGAFTMLQDYFTRNWLPKLQNSPDHTIWLKELFVALDSGKESGWFCHELIEIVLAGNVAHEICSHGFTHLPWVATHQKSILLEIEGILDWSNLYNLEPKTFIFPRNMIEKRKLLDRMGILGYRDKPKEVRTRGKTGKLLNLINEFNLNAKSQTIEAGLNHPVAIPGNFMLNWRCGPRRLIPATLTVHRFKKALEHAQRTGGVVHIWSHPHNFITGKDQQNLFQRCMGILGNKVALGEINAITQQQYITRV